MASIGSEVSGRAAASRKAEGGAWYLNPRNYLIGIFTVLAIALFSIWYQQTFAHKYGMDSHDPVFDIYWMRYLYIELVVEAIAAVSIWGYLWLSKEKTLEGLAPKEEMKRYFYFVMWLGVYTFATYWAASYFAEQDGAWHQVVIRDTSFTPSHIIIFYETFPLYIILGVASWLYAYTRLPLFSKGISVALTMAVVGPFMIMPNVGLNEWGHAFWFMEELFTAPLHWGFVVLGWSALGLGGVLLQIMFRLSQLSDKVYGKAAA
jgi:methane/ammonia monooxygenase subunit C